MPKGVKKISMDQWIRETARFLAGKSPDARELLTNLVDREVAAIDRAKAQSDLAGSDASVPVSAGASTTDNTPGLKKLTGKKPGPKKGSKKKKAQSQEEDAPDQATGENSDGDGQEPETGELQEEAPAEQ